ncbi:hypothetical protein G7046_g4739 [Stylonectria norvegica]|nr:hypothetical protein G7046_g4739 [Stylonectria norvegica]
MLVRVGLKEEEDAISVEWWVEEFEGGSGGGGGGKERGTGRFREREYPVLVYQVKPPELTVDDGTSKVLDLVQLGPALQKKKRRAEEQEDAPRA